VPRLVVLNGPPGIGKSTVARLFTEHHPLSLALEQDVVRRLIGGWTTRETQTGQLARELCLAMALAHLRAGHDVIVPQLVALPAYLDRLAEVARVADADYRELVLLADVAAAERRFHARARDPLLAEHQRVAARLIEEAGGFTSQYERLLDGLEGRDARFVISVEGDPEATYGEVLQHL
jgi:predicted kinase